MAADYASKARSDLSFDEVAQLFPYTIAEAATALGVSTNELKRVCRENGLTRWPIRKIMAGKSIEEIKNEAAKEKALMEQKAKMPPHLESNPVPATMLKAFSQATPTPTEREQIALENFRRQAVGSVHRMPVHSSLKPLNVGHRPQPHHQFQLRLNIPTYLDDFKYGFPSKKLRISSTKWWGSKEDTGSEIQQESTALTADLDKDGENGNHENIVRDELMPVSLLCEARKKAVNIGKRGMKAAVTRGYGAYQLETKDEALLKRLFADCFPSVWQAT